MLIENNHKMPEYDYTRPTILFAELVKLFIVNFELWLDVEEVVGSNTLVNVRIFPRVGNFNYGMRQYNRIYNIVELAQVNMPIGALIDLEFERLKTHYFEL